MSLTTSFPGLLELRENYIQSEITFKKAMNLFITQMCTLTQREGDIFFLRSRTVSTISTWKWILPG
ncbi:MAG: hypothetical protein GY757_35165 [bacterium]|nr:hypothetical protein [bacterium]